jgi:hypothetical protein
MGGAYSTYGGEDGWWENLREGDHLEDPGLDVRIILRWIFRKWGRGAWTRSTRFRIGTGGGLL